MCCTWSRKYRTQKLRKNRHLRTIARLCRVISSQFIRHISTIGKNLLNRNISPTCSHTMVNVGQSTAEIGSGVRGTPAYFNGFRVLTSLLHRRRLTEVNQTFARYLAVSWATTPWAIKRSQHIFVCNLVKNQQILMRFSLLDLQMNDIREGVNFFDLT